MVSVGASPCPSGRSFRKSSPEGQAPPAGEGSGPAGYEQEWGGSRGNLIDLPVGWLLSISLGKLQDKPRRDPWHKEGSQILADRSSCSLSVSEKASPSQQLLRQKTLGSFLAPYFLTPNDVSISKSYCLILQNIFRILPSSPLSPWSSHHCLPLVQLPQPPHWSPCFHPCCQ